MKHIKLFNTVQEQAAYDILPCTSCVKYLNNSVLIHILNPSNIPSNEHEYVEIGGVKWATMNVGASAPEDYGMYFAFGEIIEKNNYTWETYQYGTSSSNLTKYNSTDNKVVLDASDDAVAVIWGGNWTLPTKAELDSLIENTNSIWTDLNGIHGRLFTDKTNNSKSIFIPASGYKESTGSYGIGDNGCIRSCTLDSTDNKNAYRFFFLSNYELVDNTDRYYGFPCRGVLRV